ncbi:unnamed protein product [Rotaria sordida]|uniref:3CxxC-type domain-containing protein n=1 Tax=Rotaria sordida TaxID=392033 RepID=A0A814P8Y1_9BILA|nr:unnamed protein product [Rotaria sordida]
MMQNNWFQPFASKFYKTLDYYKIPGWILKRIPDNVDTSRNALIQGQQQKWRFRTHNARAKFQCHKCKKKWTSAFTTIIWRAQWKTGIVQITIEKQGCRRCNTQCQVFFIEDEQIEFALDWMCRWMLNDFYEISDEDTNSSDDEPDANVESVGPHDYQRCAAGRKGTCKKCNQMAQLQFK